MNVIRCYDLALMAAIRFSLQTLRAFFPAQSAFLNVNLPTIVYIKTV